MCACDLLIVDKELSPFVPITLIIFIGVNLLLVFIGLISNIENRSNHCCTHFSMSFELCILLILSHLNISVHLFLNNTFCLKLVCLE